MTFYITNSWSIEADNHSAAQEISLPYMDPEGLLLFAKELITRPCPKPQTLISLRFNLLLSSHLRLHLPNNHFLSDYMTEIVYEYAGIATGYGLED